MFRASRLAVVLAATLLAVACFEPPLNVGAIQVGRSLNVDQSIATITTAFEPRETAYVSVLTPARGKGTIRVRWYFGTQLLSEREKSVKFQGAGATAFNISSAGGFPVGNYSVEVLLDGTSVGRRSFEVVNPPD